MRFQFIAEPHGGKRSLAVLSNPTPPTQSDDALCGPVLHNGRTSGYISQWSFKVWPMCKSSRPFHWLNHSGHYIIAITLTLSTTWELYHNQTLLMELCPSSLTGRLLIIHSLGWMMNLVARRLRGFRGAFIVCLILCKTGRTNKQLAAITRKPSSSDVQRECGYWLVCTVTL